jgi:hypothetical protein
MAAYAGVDAAYYFVGALRGGPQVLRDHVGQSEPANGFIERARGRFRARIDAAFDIWQERPDNWQRIRWEIYLDQAKGETLIFFTILKFSGESFVLESSPGSLLYLANGMIRTVTRVTAKETVSPDAVAAVTEAVQELSAALRPPPPPEPLVGGDRLGEG